MDIEFTQKLQNIMGKGVQTSTTNTPNGTTRAMPPTELEHESYPSQHGIQQASDENSRFSISPVSENRPSNLSFAGKQSYHIIYHK